MSIYPPATSCKHFLSFKQRSQRSALSVYSRTKEWHLITTLSLYGRASTTQYRLMESVLLLTSSSMTPKNANKSTESWSYFQSWVEWPWQNIYQALNQSESKHAAALPPGATGDIMYVSCISIFVFGLASPVPWFHPGPCRNKELQPSAQTSAAASFSWYSAVSSASLPSVLSPAPEESRAWTAETTLQAPCSWTVLHGHTRRDKVNLQN